MKEDSLSFLQLFAEAGIGDTGVTAPDAGVQGVKQNVTADTAQLPQTAASDAEAEFEALIRGKYKQQYNARVRDIVQKRLKDRPKTHAQTEQPEADRLAQQRHIQARQQHDQWLWQAQQARELYPSLELAQEIENPRFQALLRAGVEVADAYLVVHRDDIIPAAMHYTAKTVEEKLARGIAANGLRPGENAMNPRASAVVNHQVSHMSREQRQDIIRRVRQGEIISF